MMLKTLYHNAPQKARGAAEILTAASACVMLCMVLASACTRGGSPAQTAVCAPALAGPAIPEYSAGEGPEEAVEVIRYGAPYTTEYDYGLESAGPEESAGVTVGEGLEEDGPRGGSWTRHEDVEQVMESGRVLAGPAIPEYSDGAKENADPEEDGQRVEPPVPTAVAAPAEAGPESPEKTAPVEETSVPVGAWTETDEVYARMIAQVLWGECRGCSATEQAAVAWCVLNRVDSQERYFPDDVAAVIVQPSQFLGYAPDNPVTDELYKVARDVLSRWYAERAGAADVGRVLPRGYCFFRGDGKHNYFTEVWRGEDVWDWSLPDPYAGEGVIG